MSDFKDKFIRTHFTLMMTEDDTVKCTRIRYPLSVKNFAILLVMRKIYE